MACPHTPRMDLWDCARQRAHDEGGWLSLYFSCSPDSRDIMTDLLGHGLRKCLTHGGL